MDIKLQKIYYSEWKNDESKNPWEIKDLCLSDQNLIVGKNAVGKSRTIRIIHNLANIISQKMPLLEGYWNVEFKITDSKIQHILKYELEISNGKTLKEIITLDGKEKLKRNSKTYIYSEKRKENTPIDPPVGKLVLHIRRDATEYKFFEYLINWAETLFGYTSSQTKSDVIIIPRNEQNLISLNTVPTAVDLLDANSKKQVIEDFNNIGFDIEDFKSEIIPGQPFNVKFLHIKEKGIKHFINQIEMSDGMFKTFALLIIVQQLISKKIASTILVDDLCEGLDYDRSTKFSKLLFKKMEKSNIQFIATTNDRFLMNAVPLDYWNILKREEGIVTAYSYKNNKEIFDDFKSTGLSNFDFFSSNFLSKLKNK